MVGCELVVSGSDTPTLLDLVEEPLDEVARAVKDLAGCKAQLCGQAIDVDDSP
jgi:hypothetical protein